MDLQIILNFPVIFNAHGHIRIIHGNDNRVVPFITCATLSFDDNSDVLVSVCEEIGIGGHNFIIDEQFAFDGRHALRDTLWPCLLEDL